MSSHKAQPGNHKSLLLQIGIIFLATLVVYAPALQAGFIWDDDAYVTKNPLLTSPEGWSQIWFSTHHQSQYFPLVFSTLRLEYALWKLHPLGYHLINILLHATNASLVLVLLRRLAIPGAWLAALLFALHPVQVESVAWITELKNTESTCFYLLALLVWLKSLDQVPSRALRFYLLALFLYLLALFAKTTACTLPAAMVLALWLRRRPLTGKLWLQIGLFFILGIAMGLVSVWWEGHLGNYQEKFRLHFTFVERALIATRAVWFYLGKLLWPVNLTFSYPRWVIQPQRIIDYSWAIACVGLGALLWVKRRQWRGTIAAVIFFVATLSPMLGFIPLFTFYYTFVADHYQYLACLGPLALFSAGLEWLARKARANRAAQLSSCFFLLAILGVLTWRQSQAYQGPETLWRDTLKKNPNSWLAHCDLGVILAARGDRAEAETHYLEALRLNPSDGDAHYNFANLLVATGRKEEALDHYRQALSFSPNDAEIHNNFAVALFSSRRVDEAIEQFSQAIHLRPQHLSAHYNLAIAFEARKQFTEAAREYSEVLKLDRNFAPAQARLRVMQNKIQAEQPQPNAPAH